MPNPNMYSFKVLNIHDMTHEILSANLMHLQGRKSQESDIAWKRVQLRFRDEAYDEVNNKHYEFLNKSL